MILTMGVQNCMPKATFYRGLVCVTRVEKITLSRIPNQLNYCAESTVHTDLQMW